MIMFQSAEGNWFEGLSKRYPWPQSRKSKLSNHKRNLRNHAFTRRKPSILYFYATRRGGCTRNHASENQISRFHATETPLNHADCKTRLSPIWGRGWSPVCRYTQLDVIGMQVSSTAPLPSIAFRCTLGLWCALWWRREFVRPLWLIMVDNYNYNLF